jgi:uncharacterized protein
MLRLTKPVIDFPVGSHVSAARKLAMITGATSGIGEAYAAYFASHGYDLIITGRRSDVILGVASALKSRYGVSVEVIIADLSINRDVSQLLLLISKKKNIEVLVNNAGYGMDSRFSEDEIVHQLTMLKVHVSTPLRLIHKVLPIMMKNRFGIIINVSSLAASFPTAGNAMYTSTKSFLKNFTESLHLDVGNYGLKVQCLCPGFTYSDFHRNHTLPWKRMKPGLAYWMYPSEVVDYSISCLKKGQVVCIPGFLNRFFGLLVKAVPRSLYYLIALKTDKKNRTLQPSSDLAFIHSLQGKTA